METWLETVSVALGGEATWRGGEIRLRFDRVAFKRSRLARWFGKPDAPCPCDLGLRVTIPGQLEAETVAWARYPHGFPLAVGPFCEPGPMLAAVRGVKFEVTELVDRGAAAIVRAGLFEQPAGDVASGDLAALEPAARRFVAWWLSPAASTRWSAPRRAALAHPAITGFALRLRWQSTGAESLTFHRAGEQFFVRTYGGCVAPVETWYGPFVARGEGYVLA